MDHKSTPLKQPLFNINTLYIVPQSTAIKDRPVTLFSVDTQNKQLQRANGTVSGARL